MKAVSTSRLNRGTGSAIDDRLLRGLAMAVVLLLLSRPSTGQERQVTFVGEIRVRPEFRDNADFDKGGPDRMRFFGQRTRFGLDLEVNPKVRGRVVGQDTRFWGTSPATFDTTSGGNALGLLEGYLELRWIWDLPLDMRLGRQPLAYGRERFIGTDDWSNASRTFDAWKLRFGLGAFFFDVFSAKLVDTNVPGGTGRSDEDHNFSSVYFSKEGDRLQLLDLYWLRSIDKTRASSTGETKRFTYGVLGRYGIIDDLSIEIEYAYQGGDSASVDISAHALAAELVWRPENSRELAARLGFDWATGDRDGPVDGKLETFDQLAPSPHLFLGNMDYVGRQNIQNLWAAAEGKLTGALNGRLDAHWFRLDRPEDAWYGIDGRPNPARPDFDRNPSRTERDIGIELDAVVTLDYEGADIEVGYSRWFAGDLIGLGGAPSDDSDFVYGSIKVAL